MAQWNSPAAGKTDRAARAIPVRKAGGEVSRFADRAARRRALDAAVEGIKDRQARRDRQSILDVIDEEVDAVRAGRP